MTGLKEQESQLLTQLWLPIIFVLAIWLSLVISGGYFFLQQYRRQTSLPLTSAVPDLSAAQAANLSTSFDQRLLRPPDITNLLEPFD